MNRRDLISRLPLIAAAAWSCGAGASQSSDLTADARSAWLFGLPLVIMAQTRARTLRLAQRRGFNPLNVFQHRDALTTPETTRITSPNVDTLYSSAWIDLTKGPVELTVPDPGKRYMSIAVYDMYTTVDFVIGERTVGGPAGSYRLLGPHLAPNGPRDLQVSTPHAWVLARTLVADQADLGAASALQDQLVLKGPAVTPPEESFATRDASWPEFFRTVAALVKANPPVSTAGSNAFARLRDAGRNGDFARDGYDAAALASIERGVSEAQAIIRKAGQSKHYYDGWSYPSPDVGIFGDELVLRAAVAVSGLGALPVSEAMYMRASGDDGRGLYQGDGLFRFKVTEPIPVDGFWSLTMYEAEANGTFRLVQNERRRYAIGDRTPGLVKGTDGSLDIWISRKDPGGQRTANWLPAPAEGPFSLTLRAYLPRRALMDGTFRLRPVEKIGA